MRVGAGICSKRADDEEHSGREGAAMARAEGGGMDWKRAGDALWREARGNKGGSV